MHRFILLLLRWQLKIALWFRYRITVKGLDKLTPEALNRPGGVLFLPNHPSMLIDPVSVVQAIWKRFPVRPLIVEYMYYAPGIYPVMKFIRAIPVPNNEISSNSLKKMRSDKALKEVVNGLKMGENFLLYPSGRLKDTGYEFIGGASGLHRIITENPEINIVLVRNTGLWGSSFSKAYTGRSPPIFPVLWRGIKYTFKNLLFFNPRRKLTIEFEVAPSDFPRYGTRLEINRYLENWYNRGVDGDTTRVSHGEPLYRVSYSIWKNEFLDPKPPKVIENDPEINLEKISPLIKQKVMRKVAELGNVGVHTITPRTNISADLSLDSLDMADLVLFLDEEFDVKGVPVIELTNVARMMAIAARQISVNDEEESTVELSLWKTPVEKRVIHPAEGKTIPEVFINNCKRHNNAVACGDDRSGVLTYKRMLISSLVLADYISKLPGEKIGIMLPASVGAALTFFACELAGKTPVTLNWTVGPRHLHSVMEQADIKRVISSWAFIDRLGNVDLQCIDNELIMLEDIKRTLSLFQKIKALLRSHLPTKSLLKTLKLDQKTEEDTAVILFTSGTEGVPKGVPWSHKNVLSNLHSICNTVEVYTTDVFYGVLPPFHSFGMTACILLNLLTGLRVAFYPNPTNSLAIANGIAKWGATVFCSPPTFLKGVLKAGRPEQFKSLRWVVSGAEKAPPELFSLMSEMGMPGLLREGYGITETSPVLTLNKLEVTPKGVGQPIEGVELLIVHPETHIPLKVGETGLILAHGDNVFSGYLNKMVASPFLKVAGKEWYNTGDLGNLDENNFLTISGRLKRFIKIGGEMVSLGAIEEALLHKASAKNWKLAEEGPSLAVCGSERGDGKADVRLFTIFSTNLDEVNGALREAGFSNIVKVTAVKQIEAIPLLGTGKISYRELEAKYV